MIEKAKQNSADPVQALGQTKSGYAAFAQVGTRTVDGLVARRKIDFVKLGKTIRVLPDGFPVNVLDQILTKHDLAVMFRVEKRTIEYWMTRRYLPFQRIGRHVRFSLRDLMQRLRERFLVTSL